MTKYALLIICCFSLAATGFAGEPQPTAAPARLGMNLSGFCDWSTELFFVDIFKTTRAWISQQQGKPWGGGPPLELDEHGWVKRLDPDCSADLPFNTNLNGHCPLGIYTVLYEGSGKLEFRQAKVVSDEPGKIQIEVGGDGAFFLSLRETDPADHVRNIRIIMPGFEDTYAKEPFHPVFLNRWKGMGAIRFMNWMGTNGSAQGKWADRPRLEDATYSMRGAPLELMIDLCNRLKIDPWFCMPHLADDDYVRNFAKMVKDKLDPSLKPHIEYSNEMWNSMFSQTQWAFNKAKEQGIGAPERPWEGGAKVYVQRCLEIFKIWEEVFGGKERLVRIIAWQAAADKFWTDGMVMSQTKGAEDVDALAIAPYMTFCVPANSNGSDIPSADVVATWSVDQVMDHMENKALPDSIQWIQRQKEVADKYGIPLIAYEGGQHMVGVAGGENNEAMTKLFLAANASPRMSALYKKYFDAWADAGGGLFCVWDSIEIWSKWGSWGVAEFYDTKPADSPKYQSTLDWAKAHGQKVTMDPVPTK